MIRLKIQEEVNYSDIFISSPDPRNKYFKLEIERLSPISNYSIKKII